MLIVYSKYTGKFSVDRFVFTILIFGISSVCLLYVVMLHSFSKHYRDGNINYDFEYDEYKSFQPLSDEDIARLTARMEMRREWAKNACVRLSIDRSIEPKGWEFLINKEHHLIWCNIFKAASTTWMYNFNLLAGFTPEEAANAEIPMAMARTKYARPTGKELLEVHKDGGSIAFIIVRHPFERLSSAYRDKLLSGPRNGMYDDIAFDIVRKFRRKRKMVNRKMLMKPTFEEFVRYVLAESLANRTLDIHWTPYTPFCTPCQLEFDIIIKFETYEEDQNYLVHKAGLNHILKPDWRNAGYQKPIHKGKNTTEIINEHFTQLSQKQITQLYQLYRNDLEIFNYTIDEYYAIAQMDENEER